MKVAIVYDRINKWGGAERVLLSLHKIFPNAPLFTSVKGDTDTSWSDVFTINTSFLQKLPFVKNNNELFPFLMPIAFETFSFDEYDVIISVSSEGAKGVITKPNTLHIAICLTPTRYLWSGYDIYFRNLILRYLSKPFISYLRNWDLSASSRPDHYIAISSEVKKRIKKYYKRESDVIYPSVEKSTKGISGEGGNYFLIVSRLSKFASYKNIELAIKAFNKANLPLWVIGTGSLEKKLKAMGGGNIKFLGRVNDEELEEAYMNCRALVFPGEEDFGLTMVEAQLYGKPVVAFRGGGALEIVVEGVTGEFFDSPSVESLVSVLKKFDEKRYNTKAIKSNAERFSFQRFKKEITEYVEEKHKENLNII